MAGMSKALWNRNSPPFLLSVLAASPVMMGCLEPTQILVEIWTDEPCANVNSVAVFTGEPGKFESKAASSTGVPQACVDPADPMSTELRRLGSVMIVPSGSKEAPVGIKVAAGIGRKAEDCLLPDSPEPLPLEERIAAFRNCIVARRALNFQENVTLNLPIILRTSCKDIGCTSDTTCVLGECRPFGFESDDACKKPEGCSEGELPTTLEDSTGCGHPSVFSDRFGADLPADEDYVPKIWLVPVGSEKTARGGKGRITFIPPGAGDLVYTTKYAVQLTDDVFRVQVPQVTSLESDAATIFKVHTGDNSGWIKIEKKLNLITFSSSADDMNSMAVTEPYDPSRHLWWAIREIKSPADGQRKIEMQTSPNGLEWFKIREFNRPQFADAVYASIGVVAPTTQEPPGEARFAFFNTERASGGFCSTADFHDNFSTSSMSPFWFRPPLEPAYQVNVAPNALTLTMNGVLPGSYYTYKSTQAFNLTDSTLTMKISNMGAVLNDTDVFIGLDTAGQGKIRWILRTIGPSTKAFCKYFTREDQSLPGNCPPIGQWKDEFILRVRHQGDVLIWQASSDGTNFTDIESEVLLSDDPLFNLQELQIVFGMQAVTTTMGITPTVTIEAINP